MKLSKLKDGETFLTDTNVKFQKLLMTKAEQRIHADRYKCRIVDTVEIVYLTDNILIRKNK